MKAGKVSRRIGDIVKIPLGDGEYCFGRALEEPLMAFYDLKNDVIPSVDVIISSPVLFKVWVMNYAVTSGRWEVIGNRPLSPDLEGKATFFKQDPITKGFYLYHNGEEIPATRNECEELERAAVWEPGHIEDRLRDHYAGVPNRWVESLRAK